MKDTLTHISEGIAGSLGGAVGSRVDQWLMDREGDTVTLTWIIDIDYSAQVVLKGGARGVTAHHAGEVVTYAPNTNGMEGLDSVPTPDLFIVAVLDLLVQDGEGRGRYEDYLKAAAWGDA